MKLKLAWAPRQGDHKSAQVGRFVLKIYKKKGGFFSTFFQTTFKYIAALLFDRLEYFGHAQYPLMDFI